MKLTAAFLSLCSVIQAFEVTKAEDITYDRLIEWGQITSYTEHVAHFKKLFELVEVNTFLEFGVGFSTKYFLDSCDKVISVEFANPGYGPSWMQSCVALYKDFRNWVPILHYSSLPDTFSWIPNKYAGSDWIYKAAAYQSATHRHYAEIDNFYLLDLDHFIAKLVKTHNVNVAFVDPGIYLRSDLVQLLFDKVPVIAAHDTNVRFRQEKNDPYGYSRIVAPDNYEEIFLPTGPGTTFWILKSDENQKLIEDMIQYSKTL